MIEKLRFFVDRIWYPPLLGLLAFADVFVIVIPTDGILISSSMLRPKRWLSLAAAITIGSTLALIALAYFVEKEGLPWVLHLYPGIEETSAWAHADSFINRFGLIVVFCLAASPFFQQPTVILSALANTPIIEISVAVFLGRALKYLFLSYAASHAPRLLSKK